MSEEIDTLKEKSIVGFLSYIARIFFVNILQVVSSFLLARYLFPDDYAIFGVINAWMVTTTFFTDVGVSEYLIQRNKDITKNEYEQFLGVKVLLASCVFILLFFALPVVVESYGFSFVGIEYIKYLGLLHLIENYIAIPYVSLRHDLKFKEIAFLDSFGIGLLYCSQILLAVLGYGVWALISARFVRVIVIVIVANLKVRNFVFPSFKFSLLKGVFKKSVSYQIVPIIQSSKNIFYPLLLKNYIANDVLGIFFWLNGLVALPLAFAKVYEQIFFPVLSKVKGQKEFADLATKSALALFALLSIAFFMGGFCGANLIDFFFGSRWYKAQSLIFLAAIYFLNQGTLFILSSILAADGKSEKRAKLEFLILGLELVFVGIFMFFFPFYGYYVGLIVASYIGVGVYISIIRNTINKELIIKIVKFHLFLMFSLVLNHFIKTDNLIYSLLFGTTLLTLYIYVVDFDFYKNMYKILKRRTLN